MTHPTPHPTPSSAVTIGPITLQVANLGQLTQFYEQVIGLQVRHQSPTQTELGTAEHTFLILRHHPTGRFITRTTGLYHLALRVPSPADLGAWLKHYMALGAPHWQGASHHGVSQALYLSDPEGNGLEITCDTPVSQWHYAHDGQLLMSTQPLHLQTLLQAAPATPWQGIAPLTDVGHIHLKVADIAQARTFYEGLLGFTVQTAFQDAALFLAIGQYHHHIGLNTWQSRQAPAPPPEAYGLAEFGIQLPQTAYEACLARLTAAQYSGEAQTAAEIVLVDPSGNRVRLSSVSR